MADNPVIFVRLLISEITTLAAISPRSGVLPSLFAAPVVLFMLLVLFGANTLVSAEISLFGCVLIVLVKTGIEFSDDYNLFREYYFLFGWRYGRWRKLPTIVGVTIKYFSEMESRGSGQQSWEVWNNRASRNEKLIVMLSVKDKTTGIVIRYFSLDDVNVAIDFAHDIADGFKVPVHVFLPKDQFKPL